MSTFAHYWIVAFVSVVLGVSAIGKFSGGVDTSPIASLGLPWVPRLSPKFLGAAESALIVALWTPGTRGVALPTVAGVFATFAGTVAFALRGGTAPQSCGCLGGQVDIVPSLPLIIGDLFVACAVGGLVLTGGVGAAPTGGDAALVTIQAGTAGVAFWLLMYGTSVIGRVGASRRAA